VIDLDGENKCWCGQEDTVGFRRIWLERKQFLSFRLHCTPAFGPGYDGGPVALGVVVGFVFWGGSSAREAYLKRGKALGANISILLEGLEGGTHF
jgi:hypothetical protein